MTQGVKTADPAGPFESMGFAPDSSSFPVVIAAGTETTDGLRPALVQGGFDVVRCRDIAEAIAAFRAEPDTLFLAEARSFGAQLYDSFRRLEAECPRVRRTLLAEAGDLELITPLLNEGLVHRLLLRPVAVPQIVEALRGQARHQVLQNRTSELKAFAARKSHELDLAQRLLRLQRLAAVGTLAAGLAHEINNPLGSILAFAQILIREGKLQGEDLEALQFIEQGAMRCKRVIDAVVRFAHMAGAPETQEPVHLAEIARETLSLMHKPIEGAGAAAELRVEDDGAWVSGSLQALLQLTQALVANAAEAVQGSKTPGKISVRVFRRENRACLSVADNGPGIAPELRDRIFEPFYSTKTEGEAVGLGLTTADRIANLHGGFIEVASEVGAGSTFTVVFPRLDLGTPEQGRLA